MRKKFVCGNCNFRGELRLGNGGFEDEVFCLYYNNWYKSTYNCIHWEKYEPSLSNYERRRRGRQFKERYSFRNRLNRHQKTAIESAVIFIELIIIIFVITLLALLANHYLVPFWK